MLRTVVDRAAHEVKGALNGVSLNLEVVRARAARGDAAAVHDFVEAAADELELLTARVEAILFLSRPPPPPGGGADVGLTLRHLGALLVPAAKTDGGSLFIEGHESGATGVRATPTSADTQATRLALAAGLLAVAGKGVSGRCRLEYGPAPVVRFSHESADTCTIDPEIASAINRAGIRHESAGSDLLLTFPG